VRGIERGCQDLGLQPHILDTKADELSMKVEYMHQRRTLLFLSKYTKTNLTILNETIGE
jgi:hypothetical protein